MYTYVYQPEKGRRKSRAGQKGRRKSRAGRSDIHTHKHMKYFFRNIQLQLHHPSLVRHTDPILFLATQTPSSSSPQCPHAHVEQLIHDSIKSEGGGSIRLQPTLHHQLQVPREQELWLKFCPHQGQACRK